MYYECNDDDTIRRYLTYIPATGEVDRVPNPFIKKLQRPELLMPSSEEEFGRHWPASEDEPQPDAREIFHQAVVDMGISEGNHFDPDMTIGEAMAVHPRVPEVFAAFHLGGCASCGISEFETIAQVCMGYGIDAAVLIDVLDGLMVEEEARADSDEPAAKVE